MHVLPIRTPRIEAGACTLLELLDKTVQNMPPKSVLAITSKVVSLCENNVVSINGTDKEALIRSEADRYLAEGTGKYGLRFTIKDHTLIPTAGIDESNARSIYVLWPEDSQRTANQVRAYLRKRFGHDQLGVIITDSTSRPLRRGVSGIVLAYSGFRPLHNYVGQPDLFGRPFKVAQADIAGGLAASAVLCMGEGAESTPLALLQNLTFIDFVPRDPTREELQETQIDLHDDLFAPFLEPAPWISSGE